MSEQDVELGGIEISGSNSDLTPSQIHVSLGFTSACLGRLHSSASQVSLPPGLGWEQLRENWSLEKLSLLVTAQKKLSLFYILCQCAVVLGVVLRRSFFPQCDRLKLEWVLAGIVVDLCSRVISLLSNGTAKH